MLLDMIDSDSKIRNSILHNARLAAANLRSTAERLLRAAETEDFAALAEIQISGSTWSVDQVRGAAIVVVRQS